MTFDVGPAGHAKALYSTYLGGRAMVQPYLSVTFHDKGLSTSAIGFLLAGAPLCVAVCGPLWTLAADVTSNPVKLFAVSAIVSFPSMVLYALPGLEVSIVGVIGYFFAQAAHFPLVDRLAVALTERNSLDWGKQRMWGTIAWAVGVPLAGLIYDSNNDWVRAIPPAVYALSLALSTLIMQRDVFTVCQEEATGGFTASSLSEIKKVLWDFKVIVFLLVVTSVTTGIHLVFVYVYLHLEDLGASRLLMGFSTAMGMASEIPLLAVSEAVMKRVGISGMVFISCMAQSVRFYFYALLKTPGYVLFIEPLHGIAFAFAWSAAMTYVTKISPTGTRSTMMGILSCLTWGVGPLIGTALGGLVYDGVGAPAFFGGFATYLLVIAVFYAVVENPFAQITRQLAPETDTPELLVNEEHGPSVDQELHSLSSQQNEENEGPGPTPHDLSPTIDSTTVDPTTADHEN